MSSKPSGEQHASQKASSGDYGQAQKDKLVKEIAHQLNQYHLDALTEIPTNLDPYIQPILTLLQTTTDKAVVEARIDEAMWWNALAVSKAFGKIAPINANKQASDRIQSLKHGVEEKT